MPYTYSPHVIRHPLAQIAADLFSIQQDLDHVARCGDARSVLILTEPSAIVLTRALTTSALIAYRRCFGSGDRTRLREDDLNVFEALEIDVHRMAIALADKAHAHTVASNEHSVMGVMIGVDENGNLKRGGFHTGGQGSFDVGGSWLALLAMCARKISSAVVEPKIVEARRTLGEWLDQFTPQEMASWDCALNANMPAADVLRRRPKTNRV